MLEAGDIISGLVVEDADLVRVSLVHFSNTSVEGLIIAVLDLFTIDNIDGKLPQALSIVIQKGVLDPSKGFLTAFGHSILELLVEP